MSMKSDWVDPHNNGIYKIINEQGFASDVSVLDGERRTGDDKYTDKLRLTLEASGCVTHAV